MGCDGPLTDRIARGRGTWFSRGLFMRTICFLSLGLLMAAACKTPTYDQPRVPLFTQDGVPHGWVVRHWADVKDPAPAEAQWRVQGGVLHGSEPRGTWLISQREYGDFILEFEFKLGERGNSGVGLRFPMKGDPAFDGLELQMVDPRYYGNEAVEPDALTGSLYKARAPRVQVFKPLDWNKYEIACQGSVLKVVLNGELIHDVDLDDEDKPVKRHDGKPAPPLKDRPHRGHIGFQELSRDGGHVEIRNVRIQELSRE